MEQHRELLMGELSHRVKNTLATVLSIERLSFSGTQDPAAASKAFRARIQALAYAHGRLAESNWVSVSLADLIEDELAPYVNSTRSNASLLGPPVHLSARSGLSLGLAIHELATNAAKYGALSTPDGKVNVLWAARDDGALVLEWTECGGPRVTVPKRSGFGRMLLEQALEQELGSTVTMDFRSEGVTCSIVLPREEYETRFN